MAAYVHSHPEVGVSDSRRRPKFAMQREGNVPEGWELFLMQAPTLLEIT